jgi:hypothetical protein
MKLSEINTNLFSRRRFSPPFIVARAAPQAAQPRKKTATAGGGLFGFDGANYARFCRRAMKPSRASPPAIIA